jgi:hypothetical protein
MAEGPVQIILEMVKLLIENTIGTGLRLIGLSGDMFSSISVITSAGGGMGTLVILILIFFVGALVVKFLLGSMKMLAILILAGLGLLALLFVGSAFI